MTDGFVFSLCFPDPEYISRGLNRHGVYGFKATQFLQINAVFDQFYRDIYLRV